MKQMKLLLVDDEESFVTTLCERLELRDIGAKVALNGEEALRLIKEDPPHVMVLDLRMPGIDGMEVLRRVKKERPEVQVIMLTGHGSEQDMERCLALGAFQYHKKPIDLEQLLKSIRGAYRERVEDAMVAATFAQAGDFEDAREILDQAKYKE
jgi:DNA-binding response OmpR family regulator